MKKQIVTLIVVAAATCFGLSAQARASYAATDTTGVVATASAAEWRAAQHDDKASEPAEGYLKLARR